jgi:hypothetical protein
MLSAAQHILPLHVSLPGGLCPAAFARQPCPAALPGGLARQPCPIALQKYYNFKNRQNCKLYYGRRPVCSITYFHRPKAGTLVSSFLSNRQDIAILSLVYKLIHERG